MTREEDAQDDKRGKMRTIVISLLIFIILLIAAFILQVDLPVVVNIGGQNGLPLSNKSYNQNIVVPSQFNALSVRLLTANRPAGAKIEFVIIRDKKTVVKHIFAKDGLASGEFYKFSFTDLPPGKYRLQIKGDKGTPYQLMYDKQKRTPFTYKVFTHKSIAYVIKVATIRAAKYWYKFGFVYLMSILLYVTLLAAIFAAQISGKAYAKTGL